tara:strand:- start:236 stop:397 length:162 start_codon:yes stop_codon:yes gene_type:complete
MVILVVLVLHLVDTLPLVVVEQVPLVVTTIQDTVQEEQDMVVMVFNYLPLPVL